MSISPAHACCISSMHNLLLAASPCASSERVDGCATCFVPMASPKRSEGLTGPSHLIAYLRTAASSSRLATAFTTDVWHTTRDRPAVFESHPACQYPNHNDYRPTSSLDREGDSAGAIVGPASCSSPPIHATNKTHATDRMIGPMKMPIIPWTSTPPINPAKTTGIGLARPRPMMMGRKIL